LFAEEIDLEIKEHIRITNKFPRQCNLYKHDASVKCELVAVRSKT